ncbi:MAG: winged helix-turn-helix domain-containing protein [Candidatus Diapherotrites archaeon]|nr:winged helix-turn-helix domain-containing protein [Candidatus Diapherotrites archaeon]
MTQMNHTDRVNFQLVLRRVTKQITYNAQDEFSWFCKSLGVFEPIDKRKIASQLFAELLQATEIGEKLSSTELAKRLKISRGSVINHLNSLILSGLVEKHGRHYFARAQSLEQIVSELREDSERIFDKLKQSARSLDEQLKKRPRRIA